MTSRCPICKFMLGECSCSRPGAITWVDAPLDDSPHSVTRQLEQAIGAYTGAPYVVTTTSCTQAILMALAFHRVHSTYLDADARPQIWMPKLSYVGVPAAVLNAAEDEGVKRLVFVSSDKAFEPANLYGASKFLAEGLVLAPRGELLPRCCVVRYGNVAGSTGSVIPIWRKAQSTGRPLRMTDPDCTRFWMTRREAAELVVHAAFNATPPRVVPDLPAYRLGDLAGVMGAQCDVIGLQPGEKLHESMKAGNSSADARRMSRKELQEGLDHV